MTDTCKILMVYLHHYGIFFILQKNTHNVRNFQEISNENRKTVKYGIETLSNRTQFLWANLPNEYKVAASLHDFNGIAITVYRLCQNFLQDLGFL